MSNVKRVFLVSVFSFLFATSALGQLKQAADKVRFGTGYKAAPNYNLVMWAAEEQEIWKKHSLDVEWVTFEGTGLLLRSAAGGAVDMGAGTSMPVLIALSRGVPVIVVADYMSGAIFEVYVRPESPIRQPSELKGTKLGMSGGVSGAALATGQFLTKALGLEKDVKFIGLGGLPATVAALKRGIVDAIIQGNTAVVELIVKGELRPVVSVEDYLPKPWSDNLVFVTKELAKARPEAVRRAVSGHFEAMEFAKSSQAWAIEKLKSGLGFSDAAAKYVADISFPKREKRLNPEALKNVRNFLVEYGLVKKEGLPALETLFSAEFVQ